ncbi:hypothetical protein E2C01_059565 [Portunus trituberculatus]|uniref:Uncharacterized protein n=1 Tax=Portunus trituberculatus TaxID=210409 RepID=A0A5B7GYJ6_PORTR|nr:hypothetical protein [Portunus trituberculatus]
MRGGGRGRGGGDGGRGDSFARLGSRVSALAVCKENKSHGLSSATKGTCAARPSPRARPGSGPRRGERRSPAPALTLTIQSRVEVTHTAAQGPRRPADPRSRLPVKTPRPRGPGSHQNFPPWHSAFPVGPCTAARPRESCSLGPRPRAAAAGGGGAGLPVCVYHLWEIKRATCSQIGTESRNPIRRYSEKTSSVCLHASNLSSSLPQVSSNGTQAPHYTLTPPPPPPALLRGAIIHLGPRGVLLILPSFTRLTTVSCRVIAEPPAAAAPPPGGLARPQDSQNG